MNIEEAREYCLSLKNTTECFPFDEVSLVFKIENKMFALLALDAEEPYIALKCNPDYTEDLRERYRAVEPAYHFNKKYWNSVCFDQDADDRLIEHLIDHSYEEVLKKFTKKLRAEYDALP